MSICRFRVSRLVMFKTVLQTHFYFKFRLRDLRHCLWWVFVTPVQWEVTSKEQNTQDKCAQATAPQHIYSRLIQQPFNNSKPIWSSQSLGHPNAPAIPSCSAELSRLLMLETCQNCTNGLLFFSLHNMLLTHLNQTTAKLQWLVLRKPMWGREQIFHFESKKYQRNR